MTLRLRDAGPDDLGLVMRFVRALAEYEKLAHEVEATEAELGNFLFGAPRRAEALIAEWDGEPVGFAVWFYSFSTFLGRPSLYVEDVFVEKAARVRPAGGRRLPAPGERPLRVLVLPGSRRSEISRLMQPFGAALGLLAARVGPIEAVLPAVDHVRSEIEARLVEWPVKPRLVSGEAAKLEAFRDADLALAASGTVTLELALAGLPTVAAYRLDGLGRLIKRFIDVPEPVRPIVKVRSALLPNLVVAERVVPEFIDEESTPEALAAALEALTRDGPERRRQLDAFARLEAIMAEDLGDEPGAAAAAAVLEVIGAA